MPNAFEYTEVGLINFPPFLALILKSTNVRKTQRRQLLRLKLRLKQRVEQLLRSSSNRLFLFPLLSTISNVSKYNLKYAIKQNLGVGGLIVW